MKTLTTLAILSALAGTALANEDTHQKHASVAKKESTHSSAAMSLNNGKKWDIDQTMKANMGAVHAQFKKTHDLIQSAKMTANDYSELAKTVLSSAQNIVNKCKLEPKADETFHVVLADLFAIAKDLKNPAKTAEAVEKLHHTLTVYTEYFNHPNF